MVLSINDNWQNLISVFKIYLYNVTIHFVVLKTTFWMKRRKIEKSPKLSLSMRCCRPPLNVGHSMIGQKEKVSKIDGDNAEREKKWSNIEKGREKRGIDKQTGKEMVIEEERNG